MYIVFCVQGIHLYKQDCGLRFNQRRNIRMESTYWNFLGLPEHWTITRPYKGKRVLRYDGITVARIDITKEGWEKLAHWYVNHPPHKLDAQRYRNGELDLDELVGRDKELALRELIKTDQVLPGDALQMCADLRPWLVRMRKIRSYEYLKKDPELNEIEYNNRVYYKRNKSWLYKDDEGNEKALPPRMHFTSIWDARVAFSKGCVTLADVAKYSWGAVLEVIGDLVAGINIGNSLTELYTPEELRAAVNELFKIEPELSKFTVRLDKLQALYTIDPVMTVNPYKKSEFLQLMEEVMNGHMSGHLARLRFTNGSRSAILKEKHRWEKQQTIFVPFFTERYAKLAGCSTLSEARDYMQRSMLDLIALGYNSKEYLVTSFLYKGNKYGLNAATGKVFSYLDANAMYIPKNFDKWSEARKREYLKEDYDAQVERWNKCSRAATRAYYYLVKKEHLLPRQAWNIARDKHMHVHAEFLRKHREACKWECIEANKTAVAMPVIVPAERWIA